jgi:hypothetical protein
MADCVGTLVRACRFLWPVDQPCTVCHPLLVEGVAGSIDLSKGAIHG